MLLLSVLALEIVFEIDTTCYFKLPRDIKLHYFK